MTTQNLELAIQLIQQGKPEQAQPILQSLIQANPQDLEAWSWYVRTCRTPQERYKALNTCLKFNPGNNHVIDAIVKLENENPTLASRTKPIAESFPGQNERDISVVSNPNDHDGDSRIRLVPDGSVDTTLTWYEIWIRALTQPNVDSYLTLLHDPQANPQRAYRWILIGALLYSAQSLIESLLQLAQIHDSQYIIGTSIRLGQTTLSLGLSFFIVILIAGVLNRIAKAFGGVGNFSDTIYLTGAWAAPLMICYSVGSIIFLGLFTLVLQIMGSPEASFFLVLVPIFSILSCIAPPLALLYTFLLGSATIRAVHELSAEKAQIAVVLSIVVIGIAGGVVFAIILFATFLLLPR